MYTYTQILEQGQLALYLPDVKVIRDYCIRLMRNWAQAFPFLYSHNTMLVALQDIILQRLSEHWTNVQQFYYFNVPFLTVFLKYVICMFVHLCSRIFSFTPGLMPSGLGTGNALLVFSVGIWLVVKHVINNALNHVIFYFKDFGRCLGRER